MNTNHNLDLMQIISEKILPEKIKGITWNKKIDLIAVNCGNYFEIQRIGFKHEEIFTKEEKSEIKEIIFIDEGESETNENVAVILQDTTVYFINLSTYEITFKTKLKKNQNYSDSLNFFSEKINFKQYEFMDENPFKNEMNFNSYSKIDVSYLNYLQSKFTPCHSFIYNQNTNELEFYIQFLINYSTVKLQLTENNYIKTVNNRIILTQSINDDLNHITKINFNYFDLHDIFPNNHKEKLIFDNFYQIYFSMQILDYISNIISIFTKIIYKLGFTFFDKYSFANGLEHEINNENELEYKHELQNFLKIFFYMGNMSEKLRNLMKKDLFEGKSLIKMDENVHFNLKNIEDIFVENIKSSLNTLAYFLNEIKFNSKKISEDLFINSNSDSNWSFFTDLELDLKEISHKFDSLYIKFEHFISAISLLKNGYRNFLSWLNSFNISGESSKNYLHSNIIDYDKLSNFINNSDYTMSNVYNMLEVDDANEENEINSNKNEIEIPVLEIDNNEKFTSHKSILLSDETIKNYISLNNLEEVFNIVTDETINNFNTDTAHRTKCIKNILSDLKHRLIELKNKLTVKLGEKLKLKNYFSISSSSNLIINNIKSIKIKENFILIRYTSRSNSGSIQDQLVIIKIDFNDNNRNVNNYNSVSSLNINFMYDNIEILDFEIHKTRDILLLVKNTYKSENDEDLFSNDNTKYSLILSDLENYSNSWQNLNLEGGYTGEMIKIDKFIDIDCSETSFISTGNRGLFLVIDNKKNKISVIDIK